MALEHLLAALEREAAKRVESLLAGAQAEADRIRTGADALLAHRRAEALGAREADLRNVAEAAIGEASRASRGAILDARARFLSRVFDRAQALFFDAVTSEAYLTALPRHVAEALGALGDEPPVIRCPESLASAVRAVIGHDARVTVQGSANAPPGISAATPDGVVEVDNTLPGRLERRRAELALEVLARLNGSEATV